MMNAFYIYPKERIINIIITQNLHKNSGCELLTGIPTDSTNHYIWKSLHGWCKRKTKEVNFAFFLTI